VGILERMQPLVTGDDRNTQLEQPQRVLEAQPRMGMTSILIWLTVLLKIPIGSLAWMWWVTRPTETYRDETGGGKIDAQRDPHPRPRRPPRPRRGPHTGAPPPAPPRNRSVLVHAHRTAHHR
jgi:hypothetical protein